MTTTSVTTLIRSERAGDWERKAPGATHYTVGTTMTPTLGAICLHANPRCSQMINPLPLDPRIVDTLWDKDVETGAAQGQNGVDWCMNCAVRRVG